MSYRESRFIRSQSGFTLIELMISLALGLLVVAAAGGLFLSNRQVFATTSALNRVQENGRVSYEMISRDIREAGGNPCGPNIVSMLPLAERAGWTPWANGITGVEGTVANARGFTPDTLTLHSANNDEVRVTSQDVPNANLDLSTAAAFEKGDVLLVCNPQVAALFRVTSKNANGVGHNSGANGNIIKPFQTSQDDVDNYKDDTGGNAIGYCFTTKDGNAPDNPKDPTSSKNVHTSCKRGVGNSPAGVVRPVSVRWTVANNTNGGSSLFRSVLTPEGTQISRDEIAAGVVDMQLMYKRGNSNDLETATTVNAANNWQNVTGVRVTFTLEPEAGALRGRDLEGTTRGERLQRVFSTMVAIRNRQGIME